METAKESYEVAKAVYDKRCHHEEMSFYDRKAYRTIYNLRFRFGHKQTKCGACSGSGRYDHNGSPPCSACSGTGKDTYKSEKAWKEPTPPVLGPN